MIRVVELFAGIGACSKALTNLGIKHEIVDAVEIEKFAVKSFNAIHGTNFEPKDITKYDATGLGEIDLIMHGSPCQDFSVAGRGAGGDEGSGTRSSLLYETIRIVEQTKPKVVIWENVKNLLSKKHIHNFRNYVSRMTELGYYTTWRVLNAKDYGIPQNRERVFTVSTRLPNEDSEIFPKPQELTTKLKDVLEDNPDERYFLTDEQVASFRASTERAKDKGNGFKFEPFERERESHALREHQGGQPTNRQLHCGIMGRIEAINGHDILKRVYGEDGMSPTISTMQGGNREPKIMIRGGMAIKTANKKGFDMATDGDGIDLAYPDSKTRRGRVGHGVAKTIPTGDSQGTLDGCRIRKLTPRECWRLMGFSDEDFDKAEAIGTSNTQLYKQAGNSIVVNVLAGILGNLNRNGYFYEENNRKERTDGK